MSYKIGVEIDGQQCITFFDPAEQTEGSICLSTIADFQTRAILMIYVCGTESSILVDEIPVNDIPPEKAGLPKIDLTVSMTDTYKLSLSVALNDKPFKPLVYNLKPYLRELGPDAWPRQERTQLQTGKHQEDLVLPDKAVDGSRAQTELAGTGSNVQDYAAKARTAPYVNEAAKARDQVPGNEDESSRAGQKTWPLRNQQDYAGKTSEQPAGETGKQSQNAGFKQYKQEQQFTQSGKPGEDVQHPDATQLGRFASQNNAEQTASLHSQEADSSRTGHQESNPRPRSWETGTTPTDQTEQTLASDQTGEVEVSGEDEVRDQPGFKPVYLLAGGGILAVVGLLVFLASQFMTPGTENQHLTGLTDGSNDKTHALVATTSPTSQAGTDNQTTNSLNTTDNQSTLQPTTTSESVLPEVTVTVLLATEPPTTAPTEQGSPGKTGQENVIAKQIVYFQPESAEIIPATSAALDNIVIKLKPNSVVRIEGHCALFDSEASRYELSVQRVQAVYAYLQKQGWRPVSTPELIGYGGLQPVTYQKDNQQLNRRVEITIEKQ